MECESLLLASTWSQSVAGGRIGQYKGGHTSATPSAWEGLARFDSNQQPEIGAGAGGFVDSFDPQPQAQPQLQLTQVQPNPDRYTVPAPSKLLSPPLGTPCAVADKTEGCV